MTDKAPPAPERPIPAWVPFPHLLRRPEGLGPLSHSPRDRALRWLLFLGLVIGLIVVFSFLIAVRSAS
jgi:hypothetical protein